MTLPTLGLALAACHSAAAPTPPPSAGTVTSASAPGSPAPSAANAPAAPLDAQAPSATPPGPHRAPAPSISPAGPRVGATDLESRVPTAAKERPRGATTHLHLTVTDLETRAPVPGVEVDAAGQLTAPLPPGHYAFAIALPDRFAFVEKTLTAAERPALALSTDCHPLRGRVSGALSPTTVGLSRASSAIGDLFVVEVDGAGQFRACLPAGVYGARADGATRSMTVPVLLPEPRTVELPSWPTSQIQQVPGDVRITTADLPSFAASLRGRRLIGMGEANHGSAEFYTYRAQLSWALARAGDLRLILLEADAIGMLAVDDYVMGEAIDIAKAVAGLRFWTTDVAEFRTFLDDLRAHNARLPRAQRLHMLGIDAQRVDPPVELLLAHRAALAISDRDAELLSQLGRRGERFSKLPPGDRGALSSLLDRLSAAHGPADLAAIPTRAGIAARSIRNQLDYLASPVELRDRAMAELARHILELSGSRQAALWAHDGHVARQPDGSTRALGQYLADQLGDAYYPIAFLSYQGAGRAWDKAGKIGVIPHDLPPPPPHHLESVLMTATRFPDAAWIRLDDASGDLARWLAIPRDVREFGSFYDPDDHVTLRAFPAAFAAVVVIRTTHPSTPTPTGVRMIR